MKLSCRFRSTDPKSFKIATAPTAPSFFLLKDPSIAVGMAILEFWLVVSAVARLATAQYFPPTPEGLKVVNSKHEEGVKISYKEVC